MPTDRVTASAVRPDSAASEKAPSMIAATGADRWPTASRATETTRRRRLVRQPRASR